MKKFFALLFTSIIVSILAILSFKTQKAPNIPPPPSMGIPRVMVSDPGPSYKWLYDRYHLIVSGVEGLNKTQDRRKKANLEMLLMILIDEYNEEIAVLVEKKIWRPANIPVHLTLKKNESVFKLEFNAN